MRIFISFFNKIYNWFNRRNIVDYHFDIEHPEYTTTELISRFKETMSNLTVAIKEKGDDILSTKISGSCRSCQDSYRSYQGYQGYQGHQGETGYQGYQGHQGSIKKEPTMNIEIKSMVDYAIHTSIIIPRESYWEIKTKLSGYVPLVGVKDKESAYKYFVDPLNDWHLGYLIHHCKPELYNTFKKHTGLVDVV